MNIEESYIKFHCRWDLDYSIPTIQIKELNEIRSKLFKLGLIGKYSDGTSYGNLSKRFQQNEFIITGTQTGGIEKLEAKQYTLVAAVEPERNFVRCKGLVKASSESMTHGVIYENLSWVNAVIHVHEHKSWERLYGKVFQTSPDAEYGTPEMAQEVKRMISHSKIEKEKFFLMAGHPDGIITFGKNIEEAYQVLLEKTGLVDSMEE